MTNKDEIIEQLLHLNIIVEIGGKGYLTEKYKELLNLDTGRIKLNPLEDKPKIDQDKLLDPTTSGNGWTTEILESKGRARASALMDACEIPDIIDSGSFVYHVRGLNQEAVNIVGNIVDSDDIDPATFIGAIKEYYENNSSPKTFKNLLLEGIIISIYTDYATGGFNPDNMNHTWQ